MALNPLVDSDLSLADFEARVKELQPQGFRMLSLSLYGSPADPRIAAIWDKRPGPAWQWFSPSTATGLAKAAAKQRAAGFRATFVSGTGGGASARLCAVFEKSGRPVPWDLTIGQSVDEFAAEVRDRAKTGWIIRNGAIYDDAASEARVAAVWARNSANVAWTASAGGDVKLVQQLFDAQHGGWARMEFVTGSTNGKLLAVFRDDHLGPIGASSEARGELTLEQFLKRKGAQLKKGFHTSCFQGYGPDRARRYAAIFAANEKPVARVAFPPTGGPEVEAIDDAVIDLMKRSNIRGAALAIVKGTRLVLARGYTWAEPDYPPVQPTTCFRLGSGSKLVASLAVHQLAAEGLVKLGDKVSKVLPLTPPPGLKTVNETYLSGTVAQLLEASSKRSPRYEPEGPNIAVVLGTKLPVKQSQIASFMIAQPAVVFDDVRLDDTGYFFAGQIVKKLRGTDPNKSLMLAVAQRITEPLQITRVRSARSRLADQPGDEARYHPRDLTLWASVMDDATPRPLVPAEYGNENLETMEPSGGLSAAAVDYARLLAAMNARPYTPLGRPAVDQMLKSADAVDGHGFDRLDPIDAAKGIYAGPKGGLLQTSQAGLWYEGGDAISYVIVWNGTHSGSGIELDDTIGPLWYPKFTRVVDAAAKQAWAATDLFPTYKMSSFPATEDKWRWCKTCQGLFFGGAGSGKCPAGGAHISAGSGNYALMQGSELQYGQAGWRRCKKCQGLHFGAAPSVCPAGGAHDPAGSADYRLVLDSPYKEHQVNWRWCKKCQGLFFNGGAKSVCPAGASHDASASGDYSLAGV